VRPDNADIVIIRSHILQFVRRLILRAGDENKDDELQAMFNYVSTVLEVRAARAQREHVRVSVQDDNVYDVLHTLTALMAEDPSSMVPAFDRELLVCFLSRFHLF
jgi:signal transduction protein with GAF and PtsI domain